MVIFLSHHRWTCQSPLALCENHYQDTVTAKSATVEGLANQNWPKYLAIEVLWGIPHIFVQLDVGHEGPPRRLVAAHDAEVVVDAVALRCRSLLAPDCRGSVP